MRNDEPEPPVVELSGLSLQFSPPRRGLRRWRRRRPPPVTVINDLSFAIVAGEAVGYVAAAGTGQSSLLELITGATTATSGTVRTCGFRPDTDRGQLAHRIGVVSGSRPHLWPDLPLGESLRILADAHHLPEARWLARRAELVQRLELAAFMALPPDRLSRSRRIRGELAAALIHAPAALLLDEPTLGLDVVGREQVRAFLRRENQQHGLTLLLATTDLADVEQVCTRVLVVDQGRLVHDGDLAELISRAGGQRILVVDLTEADRMLDDVPGTKLVAVEAEGRRQRLSFRPGSIPSARILADVAARSGIRHLTLEEPDLEYLIRRLSA